MTATLSKTELWQLIHDQRRRVADVLETLSDDQWNAASLCTGWRVRDVAAHNIETFLMTPPRFIGRFVGAGFNFDRMTGRGVDNHRDEPLTRLLAQYRDTEDRSTAPPGPQLAWLGEAVIHGEDIARPLQLRMDWPAQALTLVLDYVSSTKPLLHGRERAEGIRLRATDVEWTKGDGAEVSGPARALISAMCGRSAALSDLGGDGLETLRGRMPAAAAPA